MKQRVCIVGAGFSGAVLARELVESGLFEADVFDERDHVAGNCHTSRDPRTSIFVHHYGPHIFHTSREDVWRYVNRFGEFGQFVNRVKAHTKRGVFSLPVNLLTINQFFKREMSPGQAQAFIEGLGDSSINEPVSFEEQALKFLGRDLYETFFYGYTKKQWGLEPRQLPASILKRLPVRFNYDDNYYTSRYQGIPIHGYTRLVENILDHSAIKVHLAKRYEKEMKKHYAHVFFSGPMDAYFGYKLGRLQYRSLVFERFDAKGDFQGNPVINYCDENVPFTRITEHKHFAPWENHENTVCFREYSKLADENDIPYYPIRLTSDKELLQLYIEEASRESGVTFIGRLGTYRYLDMHMVIGEALDLSKQLLANPRSSEDWPKFSQHPL